jgi:hypothetical protein
VTAYPSAVDYTLALQEPATAFADPDLRKATFVQGGGWGPYGIAGSSAVVFHATVSGRDYALRCYTREDASTPERYALLDSFVASQGLSKYVGTVTWYKEEVQVKGARWPVLKMEWIAGQLLHEYTAYLADNGNGDALRTLSRRWLDLIDELQRVRFAHGDLQHGNILVDRQKHLRLVDFDSVWIPPLQGQAAPTESGHRSYQLQAGTLQSRWGQYMDTFPGLVIYLALTALAKDTGIWAEFNNGDNMLFEASDFIPPHATGIWDYLAGLGDPEIDRLAAKLKECCAPGWKASKTLQDTLKQTWWESTGAPAPGTTGTGPAKPAKPGTPAKPAAPATPFTAPHRQVPSAPVRPATRTGSLPTPPTAPYQSAVAPQSTGAGSSGARPSATSGSTGPWWAQQQPGRQQPGRQQPPAKPATPTKSTPATPQKSQLQKAQRNPAVVAVGWLVTLAGIIGFIALVADHHALRGTALAVVLLTIGLWLINHKPRKPPAIGGGTKGGT